MQQDGIILIIVDSFKLVIRKLTAKFCIHVLRSPLNME